MPSPQKLRENLALMPQHLQLLHDGNMSAAAPHPLLRVRILPSYLLKPEQEAELVALTESFLQNNCREMEAALNLA